MSSFDPIKIEEDSNSQKCKTKYNIIESLTFKPLITQSNNANQEIKNRTRSNSCEPSFHYKPQTIIDKKINTPRKANDSSKSLLTIVHKSDVDSLYSDSTMSHLSSLLSYYASTREYMINEMKNRERSFPENRYNFIKRDSNRYKLSDSNNYYSNQINKNHNNNNTFLNNQSIINPSHLLYMRLAQLNYAKYCQNYYSKIKQYNAINSSNLSQFAPVNKIISFTNQRNSPKERGKEDSKHSDNSPSMIMLGGKNGWVCNRCNNFNFESKTPLLIYIYFNS